MYIPQSGILGQVANSPAGGPLTQLYQAAAGANAALSITACNRNPNVAANITIVAQSSTGTQTSLEISLPLAPAGQQGSSYTMRAVVIGPNQQILVQNANAAVDFTAFGDTSPNNVAVI